MRPEGVNVKLEEVDVDLGLGGSSNMQSSLAANVKRSETTCVETSIDDGIVALQIFRPFGVSSIELRSIGLVLGLKH